MSCVNLPSFQSRYFENINNVGVSVVLVCHNSSERLKDTLRHISYQQGISFPWEVLVVDNNSTDGTSSLANQVWEEFGNPTKLRIVQELKPGTMYARKLGMMSAQYRFMLFCDDDNWLEENYLKDAFEIISKDPSIAAVGGMGILKFQNPDIVPQWVDTFKHNFAAGPQGIKDGDTSYDKGCLYTAGTILDRVWLNRLYNTFNFSSTLKGRDGKSLMAGEDTELSYALKLIGGKLYYSSSLKFFHFMPSKRVNWNYLRKLNMSMGRSEFLLYPYSEFFSGQKRQQSLIKIILVRFYFAIISYVKAFNCSFGIGRAEVLRFDKAKGEIMAIFFNLHQMRQSRFWISSIQRQLLRDVNQV